MLLPLSQHPLPVLPCAYVYMAHSCLKLACVHVHLSSVHFWTRPEAPWEWGTHISNPCSYLQCLTRRGVKKNLVNKNIHTAINKLLPSPQTGPLFLRRRRNESEYALCYLVREESMSSTNFAKCFLCFWIFGISTCSNRWKTQSHWSSRHILQELLKATQQSLFELIQILKTKLCTFFTGHHQEPSWRLAPPAHEA